MYSQEWVQWAIDNDYVKKEAQEEEAQYEDIIDKYCDKLKYFFVFVSLIFVLYFVIFFIMKRNMPTDEPLSDMAFVIWRMFICISAILFVALYFCWEKVLKQDYQRRFTISIVIRQRLSEINAYNHLREVEEHKGKMKDFIEEVKKRDPPINPPVGQNLSELVPQASRN